MTSRDGRKTRLPTRLALVGIVILVLLGALGGGYVYCKRDPGLCFPGSDAMADDGSQIGAYLAGHLAQQRHDDEAAARYLRRALAGDPGNRRLLHRTFVASLLAGDMEQTIELAERVVADNEGEGLAHLVIGVDQARRGAFDSARQSFQQVRGSMQGPNFLVPLIDAWSATASGDADAGLEALNELNELSALRPYVDLHRALISDLVGRDEQADRLYDAVLENARLPSMRTIEHIVVHLARRDRRDRAAEVLRGYLESQPDSEAASALLRRIEAGQSIGAPVQEPVDGLAEALYAFASILQSRNNNEQALTQARLAAFLRPGDGATQALIGNILEQREQVDRAIEAYRSVAEDSPYYWQAHLSAAGLLAEHERYDEAAELLSEMARSQEDRWDALYLLGGVYRAQEQWQKSIDAFDRAIARVEQRGGLERRHWQILYAKGISHHQADQWPQAEAAFLRSLELNPNEPDVMNYLAYSWVERREHLDRALAMLEEAVELQPSAGYIVDSVGWAYYQLGKFERATGYLERAAELMPGDPTINDHLGDALWRVGRRQEARFQWRRALSLNPSEEMAAAIRDKLENGMPAFDTPSGRNRDEPPADEAPARE